MIWRGSLSKAIGFDEAARNYLRSLAIVGYRNVLLRPTEPIAWGSSPWVDEYYAPLQLYRGVDVDSVNKQVLLVHTEPTTASRSANRSLYNICLTTWETDKLPGDARFALNRWFQEVWVPSEFNKKVFEESGINKAKVRVIPHCLTLGPDDLPKIDKPADIAGRYVFYYIGSRNARKNPAAAIKAYLSEFSADDPVVFIYKSWTPAVWDPTGAKVKIEAAKDEVARLVGEVGKTAKTAPRVICIDRELSRPELMRLHAYGDCFVSSHRGEGFGLAILEARALGRPVIATAWGGPCDFLDFSETEGGVGRITGTDIGIPYTLVPVAEMSAFRPGFDAGQKWADPDFDALKAAMRQMATEQRRNVGPGRTTEFTPEKVGKLLVSALDEAHATAAKTLKWQGGKAEVKPRVAMVSSFNERCGIAYYVENLLKGLIRRDVKIDVLAPKGVDRDPNGVGIPYGRVWDRNGGLTLPSGPPGVLHIQHEFSFWMTEDPLVTILQEAKKAGWKTIVTLHTIMPAGMSHASFFKSVVREADLVTALGTSGASALRGWCEIAGVSPSKVRLTPNICAEPPVFDLTEDADPFVIRREAFGKVEGDRAVLAISPGFQGHLKRLGDVLLGIDWAVKNGLDRSKFRWMVLGGTQSAEADQYLEGIKQGAIDLGLEDVVKFHDGFLTDTRYAGAFVMADMAILFYSPVVLSNSAVALDVLRFGLPSISAESPCLEVLDSSCSIKAESPEEIGRAIVKLVGDKALRDQFEEAALQKAEAFDVDAVSANMESIYKELLGCESV